LYEFADAQDLLLNVPVQVLGLVKLPGGLTTMEPDLLNDKADATLTPEQDLESIQPADGDGVSEPVSDIDGERSEADPVVDDQAPVSCAEEAGAVCDEAGEIEQKQVDEVTALAPAEASAGAPDRTAEILDTLSRHQVAWDAEQAASREKSDQLLRDVSDLAGKVALLSTTTAAMTVTLQKMAGETEQLTNWSEDVRAAGSMSKLFHILMILALVLLLVGMSYLAVRQYQANQHLNTAETTIAAAIKTQQQQIANYDKHFANLVGVEITKEREASFKSSVQERINRLRNGVAEQQLYRKNNGDWFAVIGKNEIALSDPDVLEELNQAFVKSGRPLKTPYLVPPHKVVVVLRANGKGGTDIVITKEVAAP
jgi:cell division protein FtsL